MSELCCNCNKDFEKVKQVFNSNKLRKLDDFTKEELQIMIQCKDVIERVNELKSVSIDISDLMDKLDRIEKKPTAFSTLLTGKLKMSNSVILQPKPHFMINLT